MQHLYLFAVSFYPMLLQHQSRRNSRGGLKRFPLRGESVDRAFSVETTSVVTSGHAYIKNNKNVFFKKY